MTDLCKTCGHEAHDSGKCEERGIVDGCICMSCWGTCTCNNVSWEFDDAYDGKLGGKHTEPERLY